MNVLEAMHQFVKVADLGSLSAVANQLGVARSVVTRQIAKLEEHLGVKLLVRSTRKLMLTPAGSSYLTKCRVILDMIETAEAEAMEERVTPRGTIRVGLPLSFGLKRLTPLLLKFAQTYPDIRLAMDFTDRQINLIEESIDLSIRLTSKLNPGEIVRKLGYCRLLIVAAPSYLATHGRPSHPAQLVEHSCLGYFQYVNSQPWHFLIDGRVEKLAPVFKLQANNGEALAEAAEKGIGITILPDFIADEYISAGGLEVILADFEAPGLGVYAVLPSNRNLPHRIRVLMDCLSNELRQG